jgi:L-alanine-DL-glutamate epimerase-like enolase superfamily enzyme
MKITDVEAIVVASPTLDPDAADATQDALIVRVTSDEGIVGIGEANHSPATVKAFIEARASHSWSRGVRDLLVGSDPSDPPALWRRLYRETIMSGRRGLGVAALAAIDVALWDLRGKAEGKPVYELLGGPTGNEVVPYSSIYTGPASFDEAVDGCGRLVEESRKLGFRAAKLETLVDCVPEHEQVVGLVESVAPALDDMALMVDVGHRFESPAQALYHFGGLESFSPVFVETPLWLDDVDGYRELASASSIPIAIGELFVTRNEFREMLDAGVDVVQPCAIRVGLSEAMAVAADAEARGRQVVLFGWVATTIGVVANIHLAAALRNCAYVEYCPVDLYPGQELRRNLVGPEPELRGGAFVLPTTPGLGLEIDEEALEFYREREP